VSSADYADYADMILIVTVNHVNAGFEAYRTAGDSLKTRHARPMTSSTMHGAIKPVSA
jgi:hypothetical protein